MLSEAIVLIPKSANKGTEIQMDVLPLVLCKDCKHHGKDTCSAGAGMAYPPPGAWFCADGERRSDT